MTVCFRADFMGPSSKRTFLIVVLASGTVGGGVLVRPLRVQLRLLPPLVDNEILPKSPCCNCDSKRWTSKQQPRPPVRIGLLQPPYSITQLRLQLIPRSVIPEHESFSFSSLLTSPCLLPHVCLAAHSVLGVFLAEMRIARAQTFHLNCWITDSYYRCDTAESIEATFEEKRNVENHSPMTSEVVANHGLEHLPPHSWVHDAIEDCPVFLPLFSVAEHTPSKDWPVQRPPLAVGSILWHVF
ncbi:hypothetical protein HG530_005277 [Fusarium avenaceum]|nr:hypothetical protein HG530_005277 [Fusarium avenaceum]